MAPSFLCSAARSTDFPPDRGREIAFVGRSNSGKSAAVNSVAGAAKLARVSKTPGRTQLVNFFEIAAERRLVDLPGYGFARVPEDVRRRWQDLVEAYLESRQSLVGLVITIDARRGLMALDETMIEYARRLEVPTLLLLTKADKLKRGAARASERRVASAAAGVATLLFSSLTKDGVPELRRHVCAWLDIGDIAAPQGSSGKEKPRALVSGDAPGAGKSRLG